MYKILPCIVLLSFFVTFFPSCREKIKGVKYSGEDLAGQIEILRDRDTRKASLKVNIDTEWKLYAGKTVATIDYSSTIAEGAGKGTYPLTAVSTSYRSYFVIVTPKATAVLSERLLPIVGSINVRDFGGYHTKSGRYTRWGRLFRSSDLANLTDEDLTYLSSIPLISVIDFRSDSEMRKKPDRWPCSLRNKYRLPIEQANMGILIAESLSRKTEDEYVEMMNNIYRELVTDSVAVQQYRRMFELLQQEGNSPVLLHCTSGKNRVGVATLLVLSALGVDEQTITEKYLSDDSAQQDKYQQIISRYPELEPLFGVRKEYIQSALNTINKEYGSMQKFIVDELDADTVKLQKMYLTTNAIL